MKTNSKTNQVNKTVEAVFSTGAVKNAAGILNLYILQARRYFKSPLTLFTWFFPIILVFGLMFSFPTYLVMVATVGISVMISVALTYGNSFYTIKKSTIYKNIKISRYGNFSMYGSIFLFVTTVALSTAMFTMLLIFIPEHFGILANSYPWDDAGGNTGGMVHTWTKARWGMWFYYIIMTILVSFGLSFFLQTITKSMKSYMSIIMLYVVLYVVFGGVILNEFQMYHVTGGSEGDVYHAYATRGVSNTLKGEGQELVDNYINAMKAPLSSFNFWVGWLLIPHRGLNQQAYSSFQYIPVETFMLPNGVELARIAEGGTYMHIDYFHGEDTEWMMLIIAPYMWMFVLWAMGTFNSRMQDKRKDI